MVKALLYYLRQKVLKNGLLVYRNILPTKGCSLKKARMLEVEVLGVMDEKALVLLPRKMAEGGQNTALIDLQYIE